MRRQEAGGDASSQGDGRFQRVLAISVLGGTP